jgi:glycosyl transferase family 1
MIIAAHIFAATLQQSVLYNCLLLLAKEQPAIRFIFIVDANSGEQPILPANIELLELKPSLKNGWLFHYWYLFKLPRILKKYQVTHFISERGALRSNSPISQFLLINDVSFLQKSPQKIPAYSGYHKRYLKKSLETAGKILVTENFLGSLLSQKYPSITEKIAFVGHGIDAVFRPVGWEEKARLLDEFSEATEYFVAECSIITQSNIFPLIKAFSRFKKRQKSDMKLVLLLKGVQLEACIKEFHLYKYRADVKVVSYTNDKQYAAILAASYATLYLPAQVIVENTGLNALASGSPLITFDSQPARSVYKDAVLYAGLSEQSIAETMMQLYKDEVLRTSLLEKGLAVSATYNWVVASKKLWQAIR